MSKEQRFKMRKYEQKKMKIQERSQEERNSEYKEGKKRQPFGLGKPRFKEN